MIEKRDKYVCTIQNTIGAAVRASAIANTNKKSGECAQPNQQCIQPSIHRASNHMDVCRMWLPNKVDLDESNQSRELCGLAASCSQNVATYYLETVETPKGHLNQTRKNVRSTQSKVRTFKGEKASKIATTSADATSHIDTT